MGIKFRKELGQHILKNPGVTDTIITKAKIHPNDVILEIGGGTGNLTVKLLPHCKKLICIEKDPRMANELNKRIGQSEYKDKFFLTVGDALKTEFPKFDLCITNLPFQISSPFLFKLLASDFKVSFVMFQREFANRMVARPGTDDWSRLSVTTQLLAKTSIVMNISRRSFVPPPKVDSSVVKIVKRERPDFDLEEFDRFLKHCFSRKNKTLTSIFKELKVKAFVETIIEKIGIDRPAKMDVEDFLEMFLMFKTANFDF